MKKNKLIPIIALTVLLLGGCRDSSMVTTDAKINEWTVEIGNPVTSRYQATWWDMLYHNSDIIMFRDTLGVTHIVTGQVHIYSNHP